MAKRCISVVIVNYNSGNLLTACVAAILATDLATEIYVADNDSRDDSIPSLRAAFSDKDNLTIITNRRNLGFAEANNRVVRLCQSDYVLLVNPDVILAKDCLENLGRWLEKDPHFACYACRMVQGNRPDLLDGAGDAYHVSGRVWRRGYGVPSGGAYLRTEEVFSPCAAAALYRREAFEAVGGFDEDFFCYLEDVDLGFRLRLAGYRCLYVANAIVDHKGSATTGKESDFVVYHGHRNLVWTYVKNMPSPLFWIYLPLHIAANIYVVVRYSLKGRWRVILKAKWDAVKGLPKMWRKRREIQSRRMVSAREIREVMEKGCPRPRLKTGNGN